MTPVSAIRLEENLKARSRAATRKVKQSKTVLPKGKKRVTPLSQKAEAQKAAGHDAPRPNAAKKATPAKSRRPGKASTGGPKRVTLAWLSAKGKEIVKGDKVKTADGVVIEVLGRWTKRPASGDLPFVTGTIVTAPAGALTQTASKGKTRGKGDRLAAEASTVVHV